MDIKNIRQYLGFTRIMPPKMIEKPKEFCPVCGQEIIQNVEVEEVAEVSQDHVNIDTDNLIIQDLGKGQFKLTAASEEQINLVREQFDRDEKRPITIATQKLQSSVSKADGNSITIELKAL